MAWWALLTLAELEDRHGRAVIRIDGRQILVLQGASAIHALPNRCPHEGYPLSEGTLSQGCVLTCNWHNWKFDLESGETLVGGDRVERFPVRIEGGQVLADLAPPDPALRVREVLANIEQALERADEQRLVRETARLVRLGADPLDAVRTAIAWAPERMEFGMTHALAGAPDWLALHDKAAPGSAERLAALGEILGHVADDAQEARRRFPYAEGAAPWDEAAFLDAIEREDETAALRLVRGALEAGIPVAALAPVLDAAALAHYADFGHALIYAVKAVELLDRLGPGPAGPLLAMLVRALVMAPREDLLPEFRDYASRLAGWGAAIGEASAPDAAALERVSARSAMARVASWGTVHPPEQVFAVLVEAAARILLRVEAAALSRVDAPLAENVSWLDFTHALTFAEAGLVAVRRRPSLWPNLLLQLACFVGRNAGFADPGLDERAFAVPDPARFFDAEEQALLDHGQGEFIISVHLLKTLRAGRALALHLPALASLLAAALNRFLHAPPAKRRHVLRTAHQMRDLVAAE